MVKLLESSLQGRIAGEIREQAIATGCLERADQSHEQVVYEVQIFKLYGRGYKDSLCSIDGILLRRHYIWGLEIRIFGLE